MTRSDWFLAALVSALLSASAYLFRLAWKLRETS